MNRAVEVYKLFGDIGVGVFFGGKDVVPYSPFTEEEKVLFRFFIESARSILSKIDKKVAQQFVSQRELFLRVGEIFRGIVDMPFGGESPTAARFGVKLLQPQDIRYVAEPTEEHPAYSDYEANTWYLNLTRGKPVYILGSVEKYFSPCPTHFEKAMICIMNGGIIEVEPEDTPSFSQFHLYTNRILYPPLTVYPNVGGEFVDEKFYTYDIDMAIVLLPDMGYKLVGMPMVTRKTQLWLVGVVFYRYEYAQDLKWIREE